MRNGIQVTHRVVTTTHARAAAQVKGKEEREHGQRSGYVMSTEELAEDS